MKYFGNSYIWHKSANDQMRVISDNSFSDIIKMNHCPTRLELVLNLKRHSLKQL